MATDHFSSYCSRPLVETRSIVGTTTPRPYIGDSLHGSPEEQAMASPKVWNHRCWVLGRMVRRQPTRVFCVARNQLLGSQKLDAQTQNQERGGAQWRNAPGTAPEACRPKPQAHGEQKKSQSRPRAWIPGRTNFGCESELVSVKDAHEQVGC